MGRIDYVSKDSTKADELGQERCNLPMAKDTKGKTLPPFKRTDLAQKGTDTSRKQATFKCRKATRTGKMEQVPVRSNALLTSMDQT